jgi:putative transposase
MAYLTPETVHYGRASDVLSSRQRLLMEAYTTNPSRFIGGPPRVTQLPEAVWINPPNAASTTEQP